jgi:DNA-binding LytR/AlgR family response regulator
MRAVIVDDEPRAIELLRSYLNHFSSIELVSTFRNGFKAFEYLSNEPVDLLFLDINMPHLSGISLAKMLPENIKIIFTTAYSEYAVESYEIQAVDYLVKPISLERFTKSISRLLPSSNPALSIDQKFIMVKSGFETFRLETSQILYLEKDGNYMTYYANNKKILARETIQESLDKLPEKFIQIHKSFIINTDKISSFDNSKVIIEGQYHIPISDTFRSNFLKMIEDN